VTAWADVCVVGAGPAGVVAAVALGRAGRAVRLVDVRGDDARRAGEHLAPGVLTALASLGVAPDLFSGAVEPCPGRTVCWAANRATETSYLWHPDGHTGNVDRAGFDRALAAYAAAAGVELTAATRVATAKHDGRGWALTLAPVRGEGAGVADGGQLRCEVVLDATGRRSSFARSQGAQVGHRDRLLAAVATVDGDRAADRRFVIEAAPQGWWYCVPIPGGRLTVAWMTDPTLVRRSGGVSAAFSAALAETVHVRHRVAGVAAKPGLSGRPPRLMAAGSGMCEPMWGPGWLAVGDAAAHVDPLWGWGVPHAVELGLRAAEAVLLPAAHRPTVYAAYNAAVRERWLAAERTRGSYYRQAADWFGTRFWRDMALAVDRYPPDRH